MNWLLIAATFPVKKDARVSAVRQVAGGGGGGFSSDLNVAKSFWESVRVLILV